MIEEKFIFKGKTFCDLLKEAIDDEEKGAFFYDRLKRSEIAPIQLVLETIEKDETKHVEILKKLKNMVCEKS